MISTRNPKDMTPTDRLHEIGQILVRGYLRLISLKESGKELDFQPPDEAPCDAAEKTNTEVA
jgi:hypothetical protein